jgi:hypothetical protein
MSDGLTDHEGDVVFDPSRFRPQFSDQHIRSHLGRVLRLLEELDPPEDMRVHCFGVIQAMCAGMQPLDGNVQVANGAMASSLKLPR